MAATIPDDFNSPIGELSGYTGLKGGFASLVNLASAQVDRAAPSPETDNVRINFANRHVDIRSMITTDPDHGRPQRDMDLLHMMENGYHQSINLLSGTASGGTWKLTWEDTGPIAYVLTSDYLSVHGSSTLHTIARVALGDIADGETVWVSYTTGTASYVNESVTLTGTTPVALTHDNENVVAASVVVTRNTLIIESGDIDWDATAAEVKLAIEAFVPQIISSLAYDGLRPTVVVTGSAFPYIITLLDETQPPDVREIGSWAPLFGVDDTDLTGASPVLSVTNLRNDTSWLQTADPADSSLTMEEVETVAGSTQEAWEGFEGSTGVTSVTVGKDADFFDWRSMKVVFDGDPVLLDLTSSTPLTPVNIEQLNSDHTDTFIDFVVPEWTSGGYEADPKLDLTLSYIQFTSDANGLFAYQGGDGITDSDQVLLDGNMDITHFNAVLTAFGTDTDWSRITAVRIHLESTGGNDPDPADVLTFMAVRALDNNWNAMDLDINTRTEHLESPVTLDGIPALFDSPFIRSINQFGATTDDVSENVTGDPNLADGAISVKFNSGAQLLVADTEPSNHIILYTRQRHNIDDSWDWEQAQLSWGRVTGPTLKGYMAVAKGTTNAAGTTVTLTHKQKTVSNFALASSADYLFKADIQDDVLTLTLETIDGDGNTEDFQTLGPIENTDFERVRGRVGFYAEFANKDVEIDYLRSSNVSFATLRTAIFHSRTPIDGAQLAVVASGDANLWEDWDLTVAATGDPTDDSFNLDTNKKVSLTGSYRFVGGGLNEFMGLQSNIVDFDDWNQMYLDFDVWMPPGLSQHNNVQLLTIEPSGSMSGTFKLTHDGAETSAIAYNATAATVQAALAALGTIGVGNVLCTGGPLGTGAPPNSVTIKFIDGLAGADISTLVVSNDSVVNGTPVVTQAGVVPQIYLKLPGTEGDYDTGTLGPFRFPFVPGTWSHVHFPLAFLTNAATNPHRVQIVTKQPTTQSFWVDNMTVGHRSVSWELRAIDNGTWYPFQDAVNDPRGALHLPHSARGTAIQLQARALRVDAWISSYTLKPHYAELGRVVGNTPPYLDIHGDIPRVLGVVTGLEEYFDAP